MPVLLVPHALRVTFCGFSPGGRESIQSGSPTIAVAAAVGAAVTTAAAAVDAAAAAAAVAHAPLPGSTAGCEEVFTGKLFRGQLGCR